MTTVKSFKINDINASINLASSTDNGLMSSASYNELELLKYASYISFDDSISILDASNVQNAIENTNNKFTALSSRVIELESITGGMTTDTSINNILELVDLNGNISTVLDSSGNIETGNITTKRLSAGDYIIATNVGISNNFNAEIIDTDILRTNKLINYDNIIIDSEIILEMTDLDGNIIQKITNDKIEFPNFEINSSNLKVLNHIIQKSEYSLELVDLSGNVSYRLCSNGTISNSDDIITFNKMDDSFIDNIESDFTHFIVYGQSLGAASYSGDVVSTTQSYSNLYRFISGVRTYDCQRLLAENRRVYLERTGYPTYGEMINYETYLSADEQEIQEYKYSSIVPLTERRATYTVGDTYDTFIKDGETADTSVFMHHQNGETPATGCLEMIDQLLEYENNAIIDNLSNLNFLATCPAYGSANFYNLLPLDKNGTIQSNLPDSSTGDGSNMNYFEVLMADVYYSKKYFDFIGKTYSVGAVLYYHESTINGSSDIKYGQRNLLQLFTLINDRVKEMTGQTNDIKFILHQSSLSTRQGQVELACGLETEETVYTDEEQTFVDTMINSDVAEYDKNNVIMGQPIYGFEYASDWTHLSSKGNKIHGAAMGIAYKHSVLDGNSKWMPIHPVSHTYSTRVNNNVTYYVLELKFSLEYAPLILDENAIHGTQTNQNAIDRGDQYGFIFADTNGTLVGFNDDGSNFIYSIEIVRSNIVRIVTTTDVTRYSLHYAYDYIGHPEHQDRLRPFGNLRDSRGEVIKINIDDTDEPVHNWCPSFTYTIN